MTIVAVLHDFARPHLLKLVNLPENDSAVFRCPQQVSIENLLQLRWIGS